jgi:tetratricopeptide (TPR) repeat protein
VAATWLEEFDEAISLYDSFEPRSGNPDDRVLACLYRANIYMTKSRPWRAIHLLNQAEMVNPDDPRPLVGKAQAYAAMKRWKNAIEFAQRAIEKG